ncbi:MAG: GNAT family N-acetyltransferase, partial [Cyanobacteria bacterium J06626_18]
ALLQHVLRRADQERLPCYLLTFTEQAVRFYQKNGFEVLRDRVCYQDFPPYWTLRSKSSVKQSDELMMVNQLDGLSD